MPSSPQPRKPASPFADRFALPCLRIASAFAAFDPLLPRIAALRIITRDHGLSVPLPYLPDSTELGKALALLRFVRDDRNGRTIAVGTILIIVILIVLLGGGGGFYAHGRYGGRGLGGVLGLVLIVLIILWLLGGFHGGTV